MVAQTEINFVISECAPTDFNTDKQKNESYDELADQVRRTIVSGTVMLFGDFSAQVGKLCTAEASMYR